MEIKIDENTIKITEDKIILISDLEADLARIEADNETARQIDAYWESASEFIKPYITRLPIQETEELENTINYYKSL